MFSTLSLYIPFTHLPPTLLHHAVSPDHAALLISAVGVSNTLGRLGAGEQSTRVNMMILNIVEAGCLIKPGPVLWSSSPQHSLWLLPASSS